MSAEGQGALIVLERETGLEEVAETGVMIHGDVSADLLRTIFTPKSPLHDARVIIRDDRIVAAGALLPLAETSIHTERFGTRHRAALGITEQTDAVVIVVSEENGQISLVERARIVRNLTESRPCPGDPGAARPGRRPARRLRLAVGQPGHARPPLAAAPRKARRDGSGGRRGLEPEARSLDRRTSGPEAAPAAGPTTTTGEGAAAATSSARSPRGRRGRAVHAAAGRGHGTAHVDATAARRHR